MERPILIFLILICTCQIAISQSTAHHEDFFLTDSIRDIHITFPGENWRYKLDSLRLNGDEFLEGLVEIQGLRFDGAGVQYTASRAFAAGSLRNGLTIKLNNKIKVANLQGYRTLHLSAALRDPSMVREVLGYEIARNYMSSPKANYVRVYINGDYYGLFVNVEGIDERPFLSREMGSSRSPVFFAKNALQGQAPEGCRNGIHGALEYEASSDCYAYNFDLVNSANPEKLLEVAQLLEEDPLKINQILDLDKTLWWLAFNNLIVNLNSYLGKMSAHYALCQDSLNRLVPVQMDMNLAFGSFKNTGEGSDLRTRQLIDLDPLLHAANPYKPLVSKLLGVPSFRKIYISHFRTIYKEWFKSGKYVTHAQELQQLIKPALELDANWGYTVEEFSESLDVTIGKQSKIPGIVELMSKRVNDLKKNELLELVAPGISEVQVAHRANMSKDTIDSFQITVKADNLPQEVWLMCKNELEKEYTRVVLFDDGKHGDGEAGDQVFGVNVTPQNGSKTLRYYIVAENAGAVSFYPTRYMAEPLSTTLTELNN